MQPEQLGATTRTSGVFHEPSANGELAPPPAAPLPGIPAMPHDFVAPAGDEHLHSDAERGARSITDA